MKKKTPKLCAGDIFTIPLPDGRHAIGSIVISEIELYIVVYQELTEERVFDGESVRSLTPVFAGLTSDALFFHRRWEVVSHSSVDDRIPLPWYAVNGPIGLVLKDFDGVYIRMASPEDLKFYGYQKSVAPITFVEAIAALHGIGSLDEEYDYSNIAMDVVKRRSHENRGE